MKYGWANYMDIIKPKQAQKFTAKQKLLFALLIIAIILISMTKTSLSRVTLNKKDLLISSVKQGDLSITVDGYGKLVSEELRLITSLTQATVKEIVLKPGAIVSKDSIIVILANPELQLNVDSAQQELEKLKANLRQLKVNNKRELLTEQATLAELASRFEAATIKRTAEELLVADGIVSNLIFKQSQLNEQQLGKRIKILSEKLLQLTLMHKEAVNIQKERIKQQIGRLEIANNRLERLQVKTGFEGVLQRLSVDLGQSLSAGQEIGLIGSTKELIAEIKVPQNQASHVAIGQKVLLNNRQSNFTGLVTRIDPIVEKNTVSIDIKLPDKLPKNTRPQQNIDAEIIIKTIPNAFYIERPAKVQAQTTLSLYKLNHDQTLAKRTLLKFGEKTGRYIQVTSDVSKKNKFIISDLSNYSVNEITLN